MHHYKKGQKYPIYLVPSGVLFGIKKVRFMLIHILIDRYSYEFEEKAC